MYGESHAGHVYVLTHPRMPGLVKIGHTTQESPDLRAKGSTDLPSPFAVAYSRECLDPHAREQQVHIVLSAFRLSRSREFFEVPVHIARTVVDQVISGAAPEIFVRLDRSDGRVLGSFADIGDELRRARLALHMTQDAVAAASKLSRKSVNEVERDIANARIVTVLAMARTLGVKITIG